MIKLVSWNVNGLRAVLGRGDLAGAFERLGADIFCVQETKMAQGQAEVDFDGYGQYWNSALKKGYSGTAVFTKPAPLNVINGIGMDRHDQEGRLIFLEYDNFCLATIYAPNSQSELQRLPYRLEWEDDVRDWLTRAAKERGKPVIVCGDLNVANEDIDLKNPKTNHESAGFTDGERGKFKELLGAGFVDTFRRLHPQQAGAYTWWSYIGKMRERNTGWRIDYFLVSEELADKIVSAEIYSEIYGSDHCPIGLTLDIDG